MRRSAKILVPAVLACLLYSGAPAAQGEKALSLPQAERRAVDLKKGMTLEEVQQLLGKPKRTSLRADPQVAAGEAAVDMLRWTYSWSGASHPERTLQVVFASPFPDRWLVKSWDWSAD